MHGYRYRKGREEIQIKGNDVNEKKFKLLQRWRTTEIERRDAVQAREDYTSPKQTFSGYELDPFDT